MVEGGGGGGGVFHEAFRVDVGLGGDVDEGGDAGRAAGEGVGVVGGGREGDFLGVGPL